MGMMSPVIMRSLREIELCAPAVGTKIWCFLFVTLCLPACGGHSLNNYCVTIYGSILVLFFTIVFIINDCPFRCTTQFAFPPPDSDTTFAKLRSKISNGEKFGHTTSYR